MSARSLPPVSAKVLADAEQFIAEFRRAENEARRSSANIDREVGDLVKKVQKKFELADVGKDILKGAGLFGGFSIAQTAAELIVSHFKDAAEAAKELLDYSERSLKAIQEGIKARRSDTQNLTALQAEQMRQQRALDQMVEERQQQAARSGRRVNAGQFPEAQNRERERIKAEMQERANDIADLQKKIDTTRDAEADKDSTSRVRSLSDALQKQEKAFDDLIAVQRKKNDETAREQEELTKLAEKYRELADPTLKFKKELADINKLMSDGKLLAKDGARAIEAVNAAMADDEEKRNMKALDEFFGMGGVGSLTNIKENTKDLRDAAHELGLTFTSAFEDAIVEGEKFGDVLRSLEKDLLRLALRRNVTEPLFAAMMGAMGTGGMFAGIGHLFGFAKGGDFQVGGGGGTDSEVVAFRATPGERVSVRTPGQQDGGVGGGVVVHQHNTFQSGVTRQEVAALVPRIVESSKRAVLDAVGRGGGFRRAFA